jgi:hypothetical protein
MSDARQTRVPQFMFPGWISGLLRSVSTRDTIISSAEAVVRSLLWVWMVGFIPSRWVSCADYPEAHAPTPFAWTPVMIVGAFVLAALSAPLFSAAALLMRKVVSDAAIRAFLAGSLFALAMAALDDYIALLDDPCANPIRNGWFWLPVISVGGGAALLAHWLVYRGLNALIPRKAP